jgi:hypothetical protein
MEPDWPGASYFNEGTAEARHRMLQLEFIERANWYELYRHKSNGTYWRLDADDKYQQRFLIRVERIEEWSTVDSSQLEMSLLLNRRGGVGADKCIQMGCGEFVLNGSAFCLKHTYERGVRK